MEIKTIFSILATALVFIGYIPYIRDTIRGTTRPHIFSFSLWTIIVFIVFLLQLDSGGGGGAWVTFSISLMMLCVALLSLKNGKRDIKKIDFLFLFLVLLTIPIWLIAKQPLLSVIILAIMDILTLIPMVRKSWVDPWSETLSLYVITFFRFILAFFAMAELNIITGLYPVLWMFINLAFALMLIYRRRKLKLLGIVR